VLNFAWFSFPQRTLGSFLLISFPRPLFLYLIIRLWPLISGSLVNSSCPRASTLVFCLLKLYFHDPVTRCFESMYRGFSALLRTPGVASFRRADFCLRRVWSFVSIRAYRSLAFQTIPSFFNVAPQLVCSTPHHLPGDRPVGRARAGSM